LNAMLGLGMRSSHTDGQGSSPRHSTGQPEASAAAEHQKPIVKVALVGDCQVGKTSLMQRYVEGTFDDSQLATQGVNFMEKEVSMRGGAHTVTFSIWDIGGSHQQNSGAMLPLVCNDAAVILLVFDLTRPETLDGLRKWHQRARGCNKCALPFLVGVKYDLLLDCPPADLAHIGTTARTFAAAIDAPLVFCAPSVPINVAAIFQIILIRLFGLRHSVQQIRGKLDHYPWHPPLLLYESVEIQAAAGDVDDHDHDSSSLEEMMSINATMGSQLRRATHERSLEGGPTADDLPKLRISRI